MINSFRGINISSKDPKRLVSFYKKVLEIPILEDDENYDGVVFGFIKDAPVFWIWDENKWGKSNEGPVCLVFSCDDHIKTYEDLTRKGVELDPPTTASWGGKELLLTDPDGNKVLIL